MFQHVKKGDVVKTLVGEDQEDIWGTVMGDHNNGALQVRVETTPDNGAVRRGQMIRVELEDVFDLLKPPGSRDDDRD